MQAAQDSQGCNRHVFCTLSLKQLVRVVPPSFNQTNFGESMSLEQRQCGLKRAVSARPSGDGGLSNGALTGNLQIPAGAPSHAPHVESGANFVLCGVLVASEFAGGGGKRCGLGVPTSACTEYVCTYLSIRPPLSAMASHSTAHPTLCATGINISNGVRGRGRGNIEGVQGGLGAVHVCKHVDVWQCAVLASQRGCAPFSLLPPPCRSAGIDSKYVLLISLKLTSIRPLCSLSCLKTGGKRSRQHLTPATYQRAFTTSAIKFMILGFFIAKAGANKLLGMLSILCGQNAASELRIWGRALHCLMLFRDDRQLKATCLHLSNVTAQQPPTPCPSTTFSGRCFYGGKCFQSMPLCSQGHLSP